MLPRLGSGGAVPAGGGDAAPREKARGDRLKLLPPGPVTCVDAGRTGALAAGEWLRIRDGPEAGAGDAATGIGVGALVLVPPLA